MHYLIFLHYDESIKIVFEHDALNKKIINNKIKFFITIKDLYYLKFNFKVIFNIYAIDLRIFLFIRVCGRFFSLISNIEKFSLFSNNFLKS